MGLYRFKEKGPAYGLGYTEGELVEIDEKKGISAACLVPEIGKDSKGNTVNTGRQVMAQKDYSVDFLVESGVIVPANAADKKAWEDDEHINAKADARAAAAAKVETTHTAAKIKRMEKEEKEK